MKRIKPENKYKTKITVTIDNDVIELLEQYMIDNDIYNRSELIERFIKDEIKKDLL